MCGYLRASSAMSEPYVICLVELVPEGRKGVQPDRVSELESLANLGVSAVAVVSQQKYPSYQSTVV